MIYDIQHVTTYHYGARVTFARCLLHLEPRGTAGPAGAVASRRHRATAGGDDGLQPISSAIVKPSARFAEPHAKLVIRAKSRVEVALAPRADRGRAGLGKRRASARSPLRDLVARARCTSFSRSRHAPLLGQATAYARRDASRPDRPVLEAPGPDARGSTRISPTTRRPPRSRRPLAAGSRSSAGASARISPT